MIDPVIIDFAARGVSDALRSFDTIEQRIVRMERTTEQSARRSKDVQERANQDVVRDVDRTEKQKERIEDRAARERDARHRRSSEMAGRYYAQEAKAEERAAQEATRAVEREEERKMRIRIRSSEMAGRLAATEAAAEIRAAEHAAAARGRLGTRLTATLGQKLGGAAAMAAGAAGIGGAFFLADMARQEAKSQQTAALIVNATTSGAPTGLSNVKTISGAASQVSRELGIDKETIQQGALTYARAARGGDIKGVLGNMGFFAKMSMITGTDINEIAGAAGKLQSQNPLFGGDKGQPLMQQMLLNAYAQSKAGSVSMTEAAKQIGTLGSTRGLYQGDEAGNQRKLLALGQIAASGGNVEDIGTYIKDVSMEAAAHLMPNKKTGKMNPTMAGVKVDKFGRMESPEQMIEQVFRNTGGNLGKIHEIFGNRGIPLFTELQGSYVRAGGGEKGIAAVHQQIGGVTGATMTTADMAKQVDTMMAEPGKRLEVAFNRLAETAKAGLGPAMEHLADKLPEWIPAFDRAIRAITGFADFMIQNPLQGIGAIIAAAVAKDVAGAGIGAAIRALLMSSAGGGVAGSAGGALGTLGRVGAVVGAAGAGALIAKTVTDSAVDDLTAKQNAGAMGVARAGATVANLRRGARMGTLTPADIARAQAQTTALGASAEQARQNVGVNPMGAAQTAVAYVTGHGGEIREQQTKEQTRDYQQQRQAVIELTAAMRMASAEVQGHAVAARSQPMPARGAGGH